MSRPNVSDAAAAAPARGCQHAPGVALRLSGSEAEALAASLKALGHPVRLQIVDLLSRYGGQVCVCDIERHFSLTQSTISHHLKVLREAGLVESEQRGLWVYYRVPLAAVTPLRHLLEQWDQSQPAAT